MTTISNDQQLELGFNGGVHVARRVRRERRLARAAWWFNRMRAVVNAAADKSCREAIRPAQTLLPGAYRQIRF